MPEPLALFGGPKTIRTRFQRYNSIGKEEAEAARAVVETGLLSGYGGAWGPCFYGGPQVQAFERGWEAAFGVRHAVAVNSATSGLIAAVGAIGIEPGDEVIVSPWTMAASATAILIWNGIPVFADIEPDTFNLDPRAIEANITPRTRAIMVPDIFGHPADLDAIMAIADRHGLQVIEDCAQSPSALYHGRRAGTVGHIGVYSLNFHKHIHTGEGGVCVSNDPELAERMQMIRNHAEAVVAGKGETDLRNMIGFNFRMNEVEAAIGQQQLKKLPALTAGRAAIAERLTRQLADLPGVRTPVVRRGCTHVYYVYALTLSLDRLGVSRARLLEALTAEGVPDLMAGYVVLYRLPLYQRRIAHGSKGFPWTAPFYQGQVSYEPGICPVAERLHDRDMLGIQPCLYEYSDQAVDLVLEAFRKVWDNLERL
jgi:perosamine synthetase